MDACLDGGSGGMLVPIYFSDVFEIEPKVVDDYGAFNVALVSDLPLFVDPFLLFDSRDDKYKVLHDGIIDYLIFLNGGTGLGNQFADFLSKALRTVFRDFGSETRTASSHLEKLGLLGNGVGRDHLSDFTTNLIKGFLLQYTQDFAVQYLRKEFVRRFRVDKVSFDYISRRWRSEYFELPYFSGDYVLLTPKDMLTREQAWLNQADMLSQFTEIQVSIPDEDLRQRVDEHFLRQIDERTKASERKEAALRTISAHPELLDIYIRMKEEEAPEAHVQSDLKVKVTEAQFI